MVIGPPTATQDATPELESTVTMVGSEEIHTADTFSTVVGSLSKVPVALKGVSLDTKASAAGLYIDADQMPRWRRE